jgi:hypothetical protein
MNQRRKRIMTSGETEFIQLEQGQVRFATGLDTSDVSTPQARCRTLGRPPQRVEVCHRLWLISKSAFTYYVGDAMHNPRFADFCCILPR